MRWSVDLIGKDMYTLRYGKMDPCAIGWKYLPKGSGPTLAGYSIKEAGPSQYQLTFLEQTQKFWSRLEGSLRAEGMRNPPLLIAVEEGTFIRYGASRIWVAKRIGLTEIPVIIADWVGRYNGFEELRTAQDVAERYKDHPATIELGEDIQILHCSHSHLPGNPINPGKIVADKYRKMKDDKRKLQEATKGKGDGLS